MSDAAAIRFAGRPYPAQEGESVLECLRRHGVPVSYACGQGVCQSCVLKVTQGTAPSSGQAGLKPAWRAQGYVLACKTPSSAGLALEAVDAAPFTAACVEKVELLRGAVARVWVRPTGPFSWRAGQFLHLERADGLTRSYSIASLPDGELLELHVAIRRDGRMSTWLGSDAARAAQIRVRGPFGECFYVSGRPEEALVLAGTGTGLAPLLGVVRAALQAGHSGPISLYHGSASVEGLYLWEELAALASAHPNVRVTGCVRDGTGAQAGLRTERIDECLIRENPKLAGTRLFLCGNPEFVRAMRKRCYLAGASLAAIHSDPFVEMGRGAGD